MAFVTVLLAATSAAAAASPGAAAAAASEGVVSYPASFFAWVRPANALDMIDRVPGFTLDTGGDVRGYEGAAGNVLVNGQRPVSKSDSLNEVLRRIPASEVVRIELIRGGAPGIDMQGKTVLANVIRKNGDGVRGLVAATNYSIGDGRDVLGLRAEASGAQGGRPWEFTIRTSPETDDGTGKGAGQTLHADGSPPDRSIIDTKGDGRQDVAAGSYELPVLGGKLKLNERLVYETFREREFDLLIAPEPGQQNYVDERRSREAETGAHFSRSFGPKTSLELVGLRHDMATDEGSNYVAPGDLELFGNRRRGSETILRAVVTRQATSRLSLEAGAEEAINLLNNRTTYTVNAQPIALPAADVHIEEDRSEVFVKAAWRANRDWTVNSSLRYETSRFTSVGDVPIDKRLNYLKPRLAVAWQVRPSTQLRFRFEHEVGQLNFDDFVATANLTTAAGVTVGNPNLNPEQAWVSEAEVEQRLPGNIVAVATFRHSALEDVVDRGPVISPTGDVYDRFDNIGPGRKDELLVTLTAPLDRLGLKGAELKGDFTNRWSEVTDPETRQKREISGLRPREWDVSFTQTVARWRTNFGVDVYGSWRERFYRYDLIDSYKLDAYVKPFVEWRPRSDLIVRLEAPNITGRSFHEVLLVYPGRRSAGGAPDAEDRPQIFPRGIYLRIQKSFG